MKLLSIVAFVLATSACSSPPPSRPERAGVNSSTGAEANPSSPASPTPANPQPAPAAGEANGIGDTEGNGDPNSGGDAEADESDGSEDGDDGAGEEGEDTGTEGDEECAEDGNEDNEGVELDGAQLFADNCASCHPSLPGRSAESINQAIDAISVMRPLRQSFPLTNGRNAEIDAIAAYLNQ